MVRVTLSAGFGVLLSSSAAFAGAWTWEEGHGQVVVTATPSTAVDVFDGARSLVSAPRYNKFEFNVLLEYGVTDWFTAIVSPGFQHIDIAAPVDARRTGLGYSEAGARIRILQGPNWVVSGQATVRVPGTFDAANPAAVGNNGIEQDTRLLFGYSFAVGSWPAFLDLQFGQRVRFGDPPSELRADATLGVRPQPRWLVLAQLFNVVSEGASPPVFPSSDYSKLQFSVVYDLTKQWSLQGGAFTTFRGRNALHENGLLLGAWYKF
jgi:hypothetical protein